jgi:ribokinase
MTASSIVVIGSVNRDYVTFVAALPGPGETVIGDATRVVSGGKGANQAVAASRLGAEVQLVGCVGDDADADAALEDLRAAGVGVQEVDRLSAASTGRAFVTVAADGENQIVVAPGANLLLSSSRAASVSKRIAGGSVVVLQAEIPRTSIQAAVRAVADDVRVVLNLAPFTSLDEATLERCDPLVLNEAEAAAFLGRQAATTSEAQEAAAELSHTCRSVVLTRGVAGAVVARAGRTEHVPAPQVRVVDSTGAGDALVGALAARLAAGDELAAAVQWGVTAASLSVTAVGAQASYVGAEEVRAALPE